MIGLGAGSSAFCGMCSMKIDTQLEFVPDHRVGTVELTANKIVIISQFNSHNNFSLLTIGNVCLCERKASNH
jgi:hypothetical protein